MKQYQNNTYFGGDMKNYAEIDSADKIVKWTGEDWLNVSQGICSNTSTVNDMEVYDEKLIITGPFNDVDCDTDTYWAQMAAWDGEEWSAIGGIPFSGTPEELIIYNEKLFVVGHISSITYDNTPEVDLLVGNIAWWDGNNWGEPMNGVNGNISDALVDTVNNVLYVGGYFTNASGTPCKNVAAWDGEQWNAVGDNLVGNVISLAMYRGQLYAGGYWITEDQHWIAYFDGYQWQNVPNSNLNLSVQTMEVYKDELYIGGAFTSAGGIDVTKLAKYYLHPDSVQWGSPDTSDIVVEEVLLDKQILVYPNPANNYLTIEYKSKIRINATISLHDKLGKEVYRSVLELGDETSIQLPSLSSGLYTYNLIDSDGILLDSGKVVIRSD